MVTPSVFDIISVKASTEPVKLIKGALALSNDPV